MGKVIMSGIVPQLEAPSNYDPVFANNTWEQIIEACQKNKVPETWEVGDQKAMSINGTDYLIDIIGKNHDDYADGSGKAPLTFQMHDCFINPHQMHASQSDIWVSCTMRKNLEMLRTVMPTEVENSVKEVNKLVAAGTNSSVITTTAEKLFLLSEVEIRGIAEYTFDGEGSQYAYYKAGNSVIKKANGTARRWWGRSPGKGYQTRFFYVLENGTYGVAYSTEKFYVSFAFCF